MEPFRPLQRLACLDQASAAFAGRSGSLRIQALASDLLHLQAAPPGPAITSTSGAVVPQERPPVQARTRLTPRRWSLDTGLLRFDLNLNAGSWTVRDAHGLEVFATPPGAIAFSGNRARLSLMLAPRDAVFGLGETTGTFNRRGTHRDFRNVDVTGLTRHIHPLLESLYLSIPFALLLRDGRAAGLFWDNPARQLWDIGQPDMGRWDMTSLDGPVDIYLFGGPRPKDVTERYAELTGRPPLPPRWGLGYQQCRYSYESRRELEAVAARFRRRSIPCDVLYCDIHHMRRYRVFTFGKSYPRPREMLARLRRDGFKVVTIVNPGVKDEPTFGLLRRGLARNAFLKDPGGRRDVLGSVWPGRVRYPDFLNPATRAWWGREQKALTDLGVAGIWNDMNEPADFAGTHKELEPRCIHRTPDGVRTHQQVRNLYGSEMARASREGLLAHPPSGKGEHPPRPFVVSRAGYAGIQRHAAVWTGDNSSTWEHLADSVQMLLNLGLSGVAYCGADVGGFLGNTTAELLVRWTQLAVFTPFLRNHADIHSRRQEPWAFDEATESIIRTFLNLRYQLLPYLYGLFRESTDFGTPIMRPLLWHYPNDPVAVPIGDQFLLGDRLLVAPVLQQGAVARSVYLPTGEWFDYWTGEAHRGGVHIVAPAPLHRIPLFVRAGAILPMTATRPFIGPTEPETVLLHLWPREAGTLDWYDDDGQTQAYAGGVWQRRTITSTFTPRGGVLRIGALTGSYRGSTRAWRILLRACSRHHKVRVHGKVLKTDFVPELQLLAFTLPAAPSDLEARWS